MNNILNFIFEVMFVASLFKTFQLITVFFNKDRVLTEKGHTHLGIALAGLIFSGLQLFNIVDFIKLVIK